MDRLDGALERGVRLVLVSAPAGFGKTTLLSDWVHRRGAGDAPLRVAWVSLDESDNDPARFMAYLIGALQTLAPGVGQAVLGALGAPEPPPIESLLTALINEVAGAVELQAAVLVLDDYHLVEVPSIHQAMAFLLKRLPAPPRGPHLVIAGRADPLLPLARLRGRGQLVELRAADLRFTPAEVASFLNEVMGLRLTAGDVTALESRTEGWITGLQLAALSLERQEAGGASEFIHDFAGSHRFVLDYLVEEVLQQQPEAVQTFLLQTAILERLSGPLCDAVLRDERGKRGGQAMLEELERRNLFVVPLDDARRWYRYHHLFADLLRARLRREGARRSYASPAELHRRASAWFEENGLTSEAVRHALAAGDFERTVRLVEAGAMAMLMRGELTTLLGWLAALPGERVRARPWLCVYRAWALLLTGRLDAAEAWLEAVDDAAQPAPPAAELRGHIAAIRAYAAAVRVMPAQAIELAEGALALLPEDEGVVRSVVAYTMGGVHFVRGDLAGALRSFEDAGRTGLEAGNIHLAVPAIGQQAAIQAMQGRLRQAAGTYRRALNLATEYGGPQSPAVGQAYSGLAGLTYEWNDLDAAGRHLRDALAQAELWGNRESLANVLLRLSRLRQARQDLDGAMEALRRAEDTIAGHTVTPTTVSVVAAQWPRLWLERGDLAAASRWVAQQKLDLEHLDDLRTVEYLSLARVLLAEERWDEASALLERLLARATERGDRGVQIEVLALSALALQARGDAAQAVATVRDALTLGEPEGYVRSFVDEGAPMAGLLRRVLNQGIAPVYVRQLLGAFPEPGEPGHRGAGSALLEPLSERELEVLRLVAAGLTNRQIAGELVIALSTVKSHTHSIYGKLGVKNRTQAIAQARVLDLL
jgi:LuxR family maltose regulon positive regulatory protein